MKQTQIDYPELNERAIGWLNFLYQKATTSDDWSEDGDPHEWWDRSSTPPMCSFPRFDLQESTYALGKEKWSCFKTFAFTCSFFFWVLLVLI